MQLKVLLFAVSLAAASWIGYGTANAQFGPPSTVFGSIVDAAGEVPAGLPVVAYVGDVVCSIDDVVTVHTGDGDAEVAVYAIDVVSDEQVEGCGNSEAIVRIEIDGRFAEATVIWRAGPLKLDVTFGNATPALIPTFTPTATPANTATPVPATETATSAASTSTPSTGETATPGGSTSATPPTVTATTAATKTPTLGGGVTTNNGTPAADNDGDGGGTPIWAFGLIFVALIGVIGGGLGYFLSRSPGDDPPLPPEDDV